MYLKSLTLFGFKSFAARTIFEFDRGVTAIVGPNGCGKSNVVDSLKWVLGEQSPKSLRGGEMLDVIFNGSGNRKPLGFAEVTMTFADVGRALGVDYDEVAVTRRLYRTGESEYFLNKTACRLRDIRELFMDTGVGVISYSIIEQGKIDALLTSNSLQRRQIFEEAAGISRYKWKAREAARRLERVDLNLNRLNDLVGEVERQLGSVQRQAQRARRYQEYSTRLRDVRTQLSLAKYHGLHGASAEVSGEIVVLSDRRTTLATEEGEREAAAARAEAALLDLRDRLTKLDNEAAQLNAAVTTADSRIGDNRRRVAECGQAAGVADQRAADATGTADALALECTTAQERFAAARAAEAAATDGVAAADAAAAGARAAREAAAHAMSAAHAAILEVERAMADARTALASAQGAQLSARGEVTRGETRATEIEARVLAAAQAAAKAQADADAVSRVVSDWRQAFHQAETERQAAATDAAAQAEALDAARARETAARARREALDGVRQRLEGIPAGAAGLLRAAALGEPVPAGLRGLLADLFTVEPADARALEAALGAMAAGLVCGTRAEAWAALETLAARGEGRGTLLPAEGAGVAPPPPLPTGPGIVGWARDRVQCAPELEPLRDRLLDGVLIVESLDVARRLEGGVPAPRLVTRAGEVLASDALTGGPTGSGPLAERAELARLEAALAGLAAEVARTTAARAAADIRHEAATKAHDGLRGRIYEGEVQAGEARKAVEATASAQAAIEQELALLRLEIADARRRLSEADAAAAAADAAVAGCAARGDAERACRDAAESAARDAEIALAGAVTDATTRKVALATAAEQRRAAEAAVPELERRRDERRAEGVRYADEARSQRARAAQAEGEIRADEGRLTVALARKQGVETEAAGLAGARDEAQQALAQLRDAAKTAQQERQQVDDQLTALRIRETKQQAELTHLVDGMRSAYAVDLADLHDTWDASQAPDVGALEIEDHELDEKIKRLGGVNLDALTELSELEERHAFLTAQQEDLKTARQSLAEIIRRINRKSQEMFRQTFEDVRKNFQELFRKLFGGGRADIVLENEDDVLESGIEIIARPPGKEPRSISLLSGGEKVMTCIAVLFAVFRSRPSPFCFLDEVDAALDEANIDRFITMLNEFAEQTQFLIITHRKPTMGAADAIYGVTMPEPGVSRPISMKLDEAVAHVEPAAAGA